jgi:acetyl esterase/lipase
MICKNQLEKFAVKSNLRRVLAAFIAMYGSLAPVWAQSEPPKISAEPSASMILPGPLPLTDQPPGEQWTRFGNGERVVRNVKAAYLIPVRPIAGQGNGRAVLVVPGGGYHFVAIENEGLPVAQRLAASGYMAFVLVYRTRPTPKDEPSYVAEITKYVTEVFATKRPVDEDRPPYEPALEDAMTAIRWIRGHASEWGLESAKVHYLGFSAGAYTGRGLVQRAQPGEMPTTLGLIYGGFASTKPRAPVPPLFLAQAADDRLFPLGNFPILHDWVRAGQRVEFHLYENGGHGFGARRNGTTTDGWLDSYVAWLDKQR